MASKDERKKPAADDNNNNNNNPDMGEASYHVTLNACLKESFLRFLLFNI
jgi:hypothetical protein